MGALIIVFVACLIADIVTDDKFKEYVKNVEE